MKSSGLLNDLKKKPIIIFAVIALHFVLIIMLGVNLSSSEVHKPASSDKKTVKAVIVDTAKIEAESKKLKQVIVNKEKKNKEKKEKVKKQLEAEKKNLAEIKKKQKIEKKRLAALKKKNSAEKKRIASEKKKALEAVRKLEDEKRRKEDLAELQRKMAEDERMEAEARQVEARQTKERNTRLQSLRSQYVRLIEQKVERNWLRPATSASTMSCEVIVTQTSLGDVIDVSLKKCANDLAFQRSIERAVRKASPLPPPPSPEVFDREIHFTFKPRI